MFQVLGGALTLCEGPDNYRPAEDSFWLSALTPPPPPKAHVLDLGCGTGAVGYSYLKRYSHIQLFGADHCSKMLKAAQNGAAKNKFNIQLTEAEVTTLPYPPDYFDVCLANPPFYIGGREEGAKTPQRQNIKQIQNLPQWLQVMAQHTKNDGHIALICHAKDSQNLIEIAANYGCSAIRHFILKTSAQKPAKRSVLVFQKTLSLSLNTHEIEAYSAELRRAVLQENQSIYF